MRHPAKYIILFIIPALIITACHKDPVRPETADWTIIFYGNGGYNLDKDMLANMGALYRGLTAHVNCEAAVMFKLSANPDPDMLESITGGGFDFHPATTYRFCVDPALGSTVQMQFTPENIYGGDGANLDITDPSMLSEFISWAASEKPAHNYLLILSDHGRGYVPLYDVYTPPSKSLLVDDGNDGRSMSICAVRNAILDAGVPMSCIYMDACIMNTIETIFELQPLSDFLILAAGGMPDLGGDYMSLITRLSSAGTDTGTALCGYIDDTADYWNAYADQGLDPDEFERCNMALLHTPSALAAATPIKTFVDDLIAAYSDPKLRAGIDAVTATTPTNEIEYPCCYDLFAYLDALKAYVPSAGAARDALDRALLHNRGNRHTESTGLPSINFLLGADGTYEFVKLDNEGEHVWYVERFHWDGTVTMVVYSNGTPGPETPAGSWGGSGTATYEPLRLNQLTGWSRWLQTNQQKPLALYK